MTLCDETKMTELEHTTTVQSITSENTVGIRDCNLLSHDFLKPH